MKEEKPINLNSLVFSDEKGIEVFRKDYFMEFKILENAIIFLDAEHKYFEEVYKRKLVFSEDMNETLTEIEIKRVLRLVAKFLKLRYGDVISKSQKRELVDARRYAVMICISRGKTRSSIYEYLKIDHSTVTHHIKQFRNHCSAYPKYRETYEECFEYVISQLNPSGSESGKWALDGSGKTLEESEKLES